MRLEQLQYFVQIVECGSFTRAAHKLSVTQPALTSSMNLLEDELQLKLLVRTNRGVAPTAYGTRVYEDCKDVIEELNSKIALWKNLSGAHQDVTEVVHLLGIPFSCSYLTEEVIPNVKKRLKNVDFVVHEAFHDNIYECLKSGEARIAVTFIAEKYVKSMLAMYKNIKIKAKKLLDDDYCVFVGTHSRYAQKPKLSLADCRELNFATYSIEYDKRGTVFNNIRQVLEICNYEYLNSRESIMQKIAQDRCVGLFLNKMSKNNWYIQNNLICAKEVEGLALLPSHHYLLWLEDDSLTPAEKTVVAYIRDHYAQFFESPAALPSSRV